MIRDSIFFSSYIRKVRFSFFTGLEPAEVRYAQDEFKKFDMDVSGK